MRTWFVAFPLFLLPNVVAAQTADTLFLPDLLDLRLAADRASGRIGELNNEAAVNPASAAAINAIVANLQAIQNGTVPPNPAGLEVHVVGFYEGFGAGGPLPATASVEVDRPGTPVVLVLNAYEPITWTLTQTPGSFVLAVISWSYEAQTIDATGLPGAIVAQFSYAANSLGDYFGIPEDPSDNEARFHTNKWCLETFGIAVNTFTGDYTAPATLQHVGPANQNWLDQWVATEAAREGQTWNVTTRATTQATYGSGVFLPLLTPPAFSFNPATFALATPLTVLAPIISLSGITSYAIGPTAIFTLAGGDPSIFDLGTLSSTPIPPDPLLPAFSWVESITYDAVRNRLLVAASGGNGNLYAWDVATATWSMLTTFGFQDPRAIAYHPAYDGTFAVCVSPFGGTNPELRHYDALGNLVATHTLPLPVIDGFIDDHQLYEYGPYLAYVGPAREFGGGLLRHSYVIDPLTGSVLFAAFLDG